MSIRRSVMLNQVETTTPENPTTDNGAESGTMESGTAKGIKTRRAAKPNSEGKYDIADYCVPATDHQGHSNRIFCRVQPGMDHAIDKYVQGKQFPFGTRGDFMRWAIWRGLKELERLEPCPDAMMCVAEIMIESARNAQFWTKFKTSLDTTENAVKLYISTNNDEEALKLVNRCKALAEKIEEPIWKQQYMEELSKRFDYLYKRNSRTPVKLTGNSGNGHSGSGHGKK